MTPLAIGKVRSAESSFIVVTAAAAQRVFRREVHRSERRIHLISARRARSDRVTGRAVEFVFGVAEDGENLCRFGSRGDFTTGLMTHAATR